MGGDVTNESEGAPIYVYVTPRDNWFDTVFFCGIMAGHYMALSGAEYPYGRIEAYGYTVRGAYRRALRVMKRRRRREQKRRQQRYQLAGQWTAARERVR